MNEEEILNVLTDEIVALNVGHEKYEKAVKGLLDLYSKEKQKNKEHKTRIRNLECKIIRQKEQISGLKSKYHVDAWLEEDYISKDKIKAKIEEVKQYQLYNMQIPRLSTLDERLGAKIGIEYVLQSLLEEN